MPEIKSYIVVGGIICSGDDVECLEDCTVHKCVDCGHTLTTTDADICCYGEDCID